MRYYHRHIILKIIPALLVALFLMAFSDKDTTASFRPPVNFPVYLSGTFGEIRGNHFHAGIDIKTHGKEGYNVYAIEDGYVSRINVSSVGYGKALYIAHPNGYTSVYGHLKKYNDKIERYIRAIQYQKESFEVNQYLKPGELKVKKGEIIGLSGNSGGSYGPHLHFEIRESVTQIPLNPLAFGFIDVKDKLPPVIDNLVIYPMDNGNFDAAPLKEDVVKKGDNYALNYDTITVNSKKIGLGISTFDQMDGSPNRNGIREVSLQVDGEKIYEFVMDRISFAETRYVQAHIDYPAKEKENLKVQRCYQLPGNQLDIYKAVNNRGEIVLEDGKTHQVMLCVKDFKDNTSLLNFCIKLDMNTGKVLYSSLDYDTLFLYQHDNTFTAKDVKVFIPKYTLYDSVYFNYELKPRPKDRKIFSDVHQIHYEFEPAQKYFTVSIKPDPLPENLRSKAAIVRDIGDDLEYKPTYWSGEFLSAKTREFGEYYVTIDTTAPVIEPMNVYDNKLLSSQNTIEIKIKDDLSGIKSYRPEIDGKWALMEYDAKNDLLTYFFEDSIEQGSHTFVLSVRDNLNNLSYYQIKFRR